MAKTEAELGSKEGRSFTITVRCPGCGNLLAQINLDGDEGPLRRRFFCKKCRDTLLVLFNPAIVQPAM